MGARRDMADMGIELRDGLRSANVGLESVWSLFGKSL